MKGKAQGQRGTSGLWIHEGFDLWGQCGRIDVNDDGVYTILTAWIYGQAFYGYEGEWGSAFDATVWLECLSASVLEDFRGFSKVVLHMIIS
jgi:hypothetical protein